MEHQKDKNLKRPRPKSDEDQDSSDSDDLDANEKLRDEGETATTSSLECLDLALRLHRQIKLALEAGREKPPQHSSSKADGGGEESESEFIGDGEEDVNICEKCGRHLPRKPTTADLLRHKKHCSKWKAPQIVYIDFILKSSAIF